ncbi:MAG: class I SAM-dependent methyltransferase, partial [Nostoc sp.]
MTQKLTGVPRTMLMTTRARVEEHQRTDALFRDPKAFAWWQSIAWDSELDQLWSPLSQFTWAVRAHTFDQMVTQYLDRH